MVASSMRACFASQTRQVFALRVHVMAVVQVVVYNYMKLQAIRAKVAASTSKDAEQGGGGMGGAER